MLFGVATLHRLVTGRDTCNRGAMLITGVMLITGEAMLVTWPVMLVTRSHIHKNDSEAPGQ